MNFVYSVSELCPPRWLTSYFSVYVHSNCNEMAAKVDLLLKWVLFVVFIVHLRVNGISPLFGLLLSSMLMAKKCGNIRTFPGGRDQDYKVPIPSRRLLSLSCWRGLG